MHLNHIDFGHYEGRYQKFSHPKRQANKILRFLLPNFGARPTFVRARYSPGEESGQYGLALGGRKNVW
jgi:hypothetical protein